MLNIFQVSLQTCSSQLEIIHVVLQILMLLFLLLESNCRYHNIEELDIRLLHLGLVVDLVNYKQHNNACIPLLPLAPVSQYPTIMLNLPASAPQTWLDDPNITPVFPNLSGLPEIKFLYSKGRMHQQRINFILD